MVQNMAKTVVAEAARQNMDSLFSGKTPGMSSGGNNQRQTSKDAAANQENEPNAIDVDPAELEEMKKWAAKLRITNLIVCALLMLAAFFSLGSNDLSLVFIAMYVWGFALLLCCYELGLSAIAKLIAQNFGFIYNPIPRRVFVVLIAILCYELGLIGKIAMGILLGSECVYAYVVFKHPKFSKLMKLKHFYGVHDPTPTSTAVQQV